MKKYLILFVLILLVSHGAYSQPPQNHVHLDYTYDGNGNRLTRLAYIVPHLLKKNPSGPQEKDVKNPDPTSRTLADNINYSISPNPSPGNFQFKVAGNFTQYEAKIEVYDKAGRLVISKVINGLENSIDLSSFSDGLYELRVVSATEIKMFKLFKVY